MKILLTGSRGFIGSALKCAWNDKYDLYAPGHEELDLLDTGKVEALLREGHFDVVVHTANTNDIVHHDRAEHQLDFNLRMFCNLERCSGFYGKMIYFGTGAEYGMQQDMHHITENDLGACIPADAYGFSKYVMSKLAEKSNNIYNFRLFGVYGPGEEWRRRFISNMIYQALNCPKMQMDRNRMFDYLYIDDLVAAVDRILPARPAQHVYNLCSGQSVSLRSLAEIVRVETDTKAEIIMNGTDWKPAYTGSNERFVNEFGTLTRTPMRDTIRAMIVFYRKNGFQ